MSCKSCSWRQKKKKNWLPTGAVCRLPIAMRSDIRPAAPKPSVSRDLVLIQKASRQIICTHFLHCSLPRRVHTDILYQVHAHPPHSSPHRQHAIRCDVPRPLRSARFLGGTASRVPAQGNIRGGGRWPQAYPTAVEFVIATSAAARGAPPSTRHTRKAFALYPTLRHQTTRVKQKAHLSSHAPSYFSSR